MHWSGRASGIVRAVGVDVAHRVLLEPGAAAWSGADQPHLTAEEHIGGSGGGHGAEGGHVHGDHGGHHEHATLFQRLFWRNLVLALPVVAFSSVFVVTNSLRLRGFAPLPENRDSATPVPGGRPRVDRPAPAARN